MGHLNFSDVSKLPEYAEGVTPLPVKKSKSHITCTTCLEGKQSRHPFNNIGSRASHPLQLIHTDLCGPMEQVSLGGMKYSITFIDDFTKRVHVYFLKDKLSVLDVFKDYKCKVENELERKIKTIRSDNGKEYCNKEFESFLSRYGIEHQTSTPYSPSAEWASRKDE
jgi:transposase InsO family protein